VADQYIGSASDEAAGDIVGAAAAPQQDDERGQLLMRQEFNEMVQVQADLLFHNNQNHSDDLLMYNHEFSEDWINTSAVLAGEYNSSNINCPAHIVPILCWYTYDINNGHHLHHHQDRLHRYHQPRQYHQNLQPRQPSTVSVFRPAAALYIITQIYSCSC
jgi:hypothetical protein